MSPPLPSLPESSVVRFDDFLKTMKDNHIHRHHRSQSPKRKRRPGLAKMVLHHLFRRGRQRLGVILPAVSVLLSIVLCLPVLLVSDVSSRNVDRHLRSFRRAVDNIYIPRPSFRSLGLSDKVFDIPQPQLGKNEHGDDIATPSEVHEQEQPPEALPPYALFNVVNAVPYFHDTFAVLMYDPPTDKFVAHYSNGMRWISSCHKLLNSIKTTAHSLRLLFPERFRADMPEFALAISSADYPGMRWTPCIRDQRDDCIADEISPVLQFGSVFREPIVPTMMAMPMPQMNHLSCFHYWAMHHQVCEWYLERGPGNPNGLVFGDTLGGLQYDDLIPQVVWRGTDFSYLHKLEPRLRPPNFELDVATQIDLSGRVDKRTAATSAMRQIYDELIPRWKGVVWTAEAEREAERANNEMHRKNRTKRRAVARRSQESVPWCNIKFAGAMHMGKKTDTSEIEYYRQFEEHGIPAIGEGMSLEMLGQYKYHIDLGGGGGTTWSGTLEKLGLPGLLFHHVTPTKDYLHDRMEPWVHYVPVRADLSDLREKYEWAESHPVMARRISDNATSLARSLGTPEGMEAMFRRFYEWPLRRVVEAYQPLSSEEGGDGVSDWREALKQMGAGEDNLRPIMQCGGYYHHDCERLTDDIQFSRIHDRDVNMSA